MKNMTSNEIECIHGGHSMFDAHPHTHQPTIEFNLPKIGRLQCPFGTYSAGSKFGDQYEVYCKSFVPLVITTVVVATIFNSLTAGIIIYYCGNRIMTKLKQA